jgi:hypothetical protein
MASNASDLLDMSAPFQVPPAIGQVQFHVASSPNTVGVTVGAFMTRSQVRVGVRLAGGCSNMTPEDKLNMLDYFVDGFEGFQGFVSSGGTRSESDGRIDPMVTDVPAVLVAAYGGKNVLTLSTTPRTGQMVLRDDSRLVIDSDSGIAPQPGVHMVIVFQTEFSHETLDWDGDVNAYFRLFNEFVKNGWRFGMTVWNGGGVTRDEAIKAAKFGWPVIVVQGSGRAADALAELVLNGTPIDGVELSERTLSNFTVVHRDDSNTLNAALRRHGFITG